MEIAILILIILLIFAALTVFFANLVAFKTSKNRKDDLYNVPLERKDMHYKPYMISLIDEINNLKYEEICIISHDGLKLAARYYHVKDGAPIQIQCHGYRGNPIRDFCGGNKLSRQCNHNSLLIYHRGHGKSEGNKISFGIKERYDVLSWINYLNERFGEDCEIILTGVSMGAATILMACDLPLPSNVKCIIADCPYSYPSKIIKLFCNKIKLPGNIVYPFVYIAGLLSGFKLNESSPVEAVKKSKIPILLIHGEDDSLVPCYMSEEIRNANPKLVTLKTFKGANHGISYIVDEKGYQETVNEFLKNLSINTK